MLKGLPAPILNKTLLDHIFEEARHSLFFKNLAQKVAKKELTFKEHELLAPKASSDYFQQVDHFSVKFSFSNPFVNYLYTTYAVERRALVMYSLYDEVLKRKAFPFSVQTVLMDEKEHLDCVFKKIQESDPLWEDNLEEISAFEHQKYFSWLILLEKTLFDLPLSPFLHQVKNKTSSSYHQI